MDQLTQNLKKQLEELKLNGFKVDTKCSSSTTAIADEEPDKEKMTQLVKDFLENQEVNEENPLLPTLKPLGIKSNCEDGIHAKIKQECKRLMWYRMQSDLLDQEDLMGLYGILEQHATLPPQHEGHLDSEKFIVYADYKKARENTDPRFRSLLTAQLFMRLIGDDPFGRVQIVQIFNYVMKKIWLKQTRLGLLHYETPAGKGFIQEEGLDSYLKELLPTLSQLRNMNESFEQFYICTASRKFFFFLDPLKLGKIKMIDILSSGLIDDILDLREKEEQEKNWFCLRTAMRVYEHYLSLDRDQNGMLSRSEFINYSLNLSGGPVNLTEAFTERLYMESITYDGDLDYRTYVDFVLAMENKKEPQALHYFFRILDVDHKGHLNAFDLHYFYKDIEKIISNYTEPPRFGDVKDEIFDMVKPKDPMKITLKDLNQCGKGDTVISMLIDANGFIEYDNREIVPVENSDVKEMRTSEV